ncbi:MAG: nicotinamide-nucleotide adenylyltransferase [Promethearchaeia archaeon]
MNEINSSEELLACINLDDIKYLETGQISKYIFPLPRREAHKNKIPHLIVRLFAVSKNENGEILYLVQKRSKNKRGYPLYFTDSASGHVVYEKNLDLKKIKENAIRELEEEFGIKPNKIKKIKFFGLKIEEDQFTPEIAYIFYTLIDSNVKLKPNPEELEIHASRFYTKNELERLLSEEKVVPYAKKYWQEILNEKIDKLFIDSKKTISSQKVALFLGRFQPFHLGHLYVIEKILQKFEKIKIGIGSSQISRTINDPFTVEERKQFIHSTLNELGYKNRYEIYEIPDIFNSEKWVDHVVSIVGKFDVVYANSEWVRLLFEKKNFVVGEKLKKDMENYNASKIRKYIAENNIEWERLVPETVKNLIYKFDGINLIKNLYKDEKN